MPRIPPIDGFSFWLGFFVAAGMGFVLFLFRRQLGEVRDGLLAQLRGFREYLTSGTERALREDMMRYAQTAHLAGTLFVLDDILITPRLLVPDTPFDPTAPDASDEDSVSSIIPVLPEWPDLAAIYRAPSITLEETLSGGSHVLILGAPGMGKTTLLAHLITRIAAGDEKLLGGEYTPLFIHAADLPLPRLPNEDVAQPLITAAQNRVSVVTAARLARHIRLRLREFNCLICVDGLDELPQRHVAEVAQWLNDFTREYPRHRLVAAAGSAGYGPLLALPLAPIHIAPWHLDDYKALIQKWSTAWEKLIRARKKRATTAEADVDPNIIMGWLSTSNAGRTIYEVTLKTWAAFAGDARGKRPVDWMETYLGRFNLKPHGHKAVGRLAVSLMARDDYLGLARPEVLAILEPVLAGADGKVSIDLDDWLDELLDRRLLAKRARDRLSFSHAFAMAYCASTALAAEPDNVTPGVSPFWNRALYFYTSLGDLTPMVGRALTQAPDLMFSDALTSALWLRDAPPGVKWRGEVLRRLSVIFMDARQTESLRLRALAGFVAANDSAVAQLFKQALTNPDPFTRRMALLGLGALGEVGAILQIAARFTDDYLDVRWAATLALAAINHPSAIDSLRQGLTNGDDQLRQACAEALARHAEEGHPLLKEAVANDDLAVRRAGVYGLAAVNQTWSWELLERLQHTEQQWYVRSAIQELLAAAQQPAARAPKPYAQPESQGWLVAWAATQGLGVPPGRAAIDVLNRALKEGDGPTRRAAMDALGRLADPAGARDLYPLLRDPDAFTREVAFRALVFIALSSGTRLAMPV
jgi:HEAT repeat protein